MGDWMNKWKRSPRQDRRVVVDGKFVELVPLPDVTEREQSALEMISEGAPVEDDVDKAFKFLEPSQLPPGVTILDSGGQSGGILTAEVSYPTGSLGEHVPDEPSVSELLQEQLEPLPTTVFKLGEEGVVATLGDYQDYETNTPIVDIQAPDASVSAAEDLDIPF